jgi:hypothetical protein
VTDFERLLGALYHAGVEHIVVGGLAASAHGALDDVVYARTPDKQCRLCQAFDPLHPYLRVAPLGLPSDLTRDAAGRPELHADRRPRDSASVDDDVHGTPAGGPDGRFWGTIRQAPDA